MKLYNRRLNDLTESVLFTIFLSGASGVRGCESYVGR